MKATTYSATKPDVSIVVDGALIVVPRSRPLNDPRGFPLRDAQGEMRTRPTTVLEATNHYFGRIIPTLCHKDGLPPAGNCRLCMVAVMPRERGALRWDRKLHPACCLPIEDGMEVGTICSPDEAVRERLLSAARVLLSLLMINHKTPCMPVDSAGSASCELESLAQRFGVSVDANPFSFPEG